MKNLPVHNHKLSHTAVQAFKSCNEKHYLRYIERIDPKEKGASLDFGSAIDTAISHLLTAHKDNNLQAGLDTFKQVFLDDAKKGWNLSLGNKNIRFSKTDLDNKVIQSDECKTLIKEWETGFKVTAEDAISAFKQKKYKELKDNEADMYHSLNWLSLREKGLLMLEAFARDILPKIRKVVAIQHKLEGTSGDSTVVGYIDLIAEIEGHEEPIVLDIKTSGMPYESDSVKLSEQLALYLVGVGSDLGTNKAGFLVMYKNIETDSVCSKCKHVKDSSHKTCNNTINGKRCGAEWSSVNKAVTDIIVDEISKEKQEDFINGFSLLEPLMRNGLRVKNFNSCKEYGMCDYFALCHNGDKSGYIFKNEEITKIDVDKT